MDAHSHAAWPGFPGPIVDKILAVEVELDSIWPGWRNKQRFDATAYELKARIKWLLKRHSLLTNVEGGQPAPHDWDVIVVQDKRNSSQCYAHPVIPGESNEKSVSRNPPSPFSVDPLLEVSRPALGSLEHTAQLLRLPVEVCRAALATKPGSWKATDNDWVRHVVANPAPTGGAK